MNKDFKGKYIKSALVCLILCYLFVSLFFLLGKNSSYVSLADSALWTSYASSSLTGSGTMANPYLINSEQDLAFMAKKINSNSENTSSVYYRLTKSLNLSAHQWVSIGNRTYKFNANFDGYGYVIEGITFDKSTSLSDYIGLFGAVGESGTIQKLKANATIYCTDKGIKFAGALAGENSGKITLCNGDGNITVTSGSSSFIGGLVGGNTDSGEIKKSYNSATVCGYDYVGGIAGRGYGIFENCFNKGYIKGEDCVGGIAGYSKEKITLCYNSASIDGTGKTGGITGYSIADISSCENLGDITSTASNVGGIVGFLFPNPDAKVSYCHNSGKIKGAFYVGGVIGENASVNTVSYLTNSGEVKADGIAGGIIGRCSKGGEVQNCYNSGKVNCSGKTTIGGIVGAHQYYNGNTISYCCNAGTVYGQSEVGGIVGKGTFVYSCKNLGYIEASNGNVGGIMGRKDTEESSRSNASSISFCYNRGTVSSSGNNVGGIIGYQDLKTDEVYQCYNSGTLGSYNGATIKYIGGVVGRNVSDRGRVNKNYYREGCCNICPRALGNKSNSGTETSSQGGENYGWNINDMKTTNFVTEINGEHTYIYKAVASDYPKIEDIKDTLFDLNLEGSVNWAKNASINNNLPYLVEMYW